MATTAGDQRREQILDAVLKVIIDVGFTEMTVADVARVAGVSNALVHYHFSSKPELIAAALRAASNDDKAFRDDITGAEGTATARLDAMLCKSLPGHTTDASWLLWIETWGETRRDGQIRAVMTDLNIHERDAIVQLLEEGERLGEFTCSAPADTAARLTALRDGLAIDRTLFDEHPTDKLVEQMRSAIAYNLGVSHERYQILLATDHDA
jgi:AcrR family transcriptional regulator